MGRLDLKDDQLGQLDLDAVDLGAVVEQVRIDLYSSVVDLHVLTSLPPTMLHGVENFLVLAIVDDEQMMNYFDFAIYHTNHNDVVVHYCNSCLYFRTD